MLTIVQLVCAHQSCLRMTDARFLADGISVFLVDCYGLSLQEMVGRNAHVILQFALSETFGKRHDDVELWQAVQEAVGKNRLAMLRMLSEYRDLSRVVAVVAAAASPMRTELFNLAARQGHVAILQWLWFKYREFCQVPSAVMGAVLSDQLEAVVFFCRLGLLDQPLAVKATEQALSLGNYKVADYLCTFYRLNGFSFKNLTVMQVLMVLEQDLPQINGEHATTTTTTTGLILYGLDDQNSLLLHESVVQMLVKMQHGLRALRKLHDLLPGLRLSSKCLAVACKAGHLSLVKYLYFNFAEAMQKSSIKSALNATYALQHVDVIHFWLEQGHFPNDQLLKSIVTNCCVGVVHFLLHEYRCSRARVDPVIEHHYTRMVTTLRALLASQSLLCLVTQLGHVEMLQLVLPNFHMDRMVPKLLSLAISIGSLPMVQYLYELRKRQYMCGNLSLWMKSILEAARKRCFDVIYFMITQERLDGTQDFTELINHACVNRHFRLVQWLHRQRVHGFTKAAMDSAAASGSLSIVKFLHVHRSEGCSLNAMHRAAMNGFLHVVQFLHFHRHEGCTAMAMKHAASRGHLRVVEFLHVHRTEGIARNGLYEAALHGHLHVVQFLLKNRPEETAQDALDGASMTFRVEIVQWLLQNEYPCDYQTVLERLRRRTTNLMAPPDKTHLALIALLEESIHKSKKQRLD